MRKRISSIFLAMCALFAFQGNVSAQTADNVVYQHSFADGWGDWTVDSNISGCWSIFENTSLEAYGWSGTGTTYASSPVITLDANGNEVEFNHKGWYFNNFQEEAQLVIKKVGGEWVTIEGVTYPTDYSLISSGKLAIPAEFNGQEVQFAFKYVSVDQNACGTWRINDITVTKAAGGSEEPEMVEQILFSKVGSELCNANYNGFKIDRKSVV